LAFKNVRIVGYINLAATISIALFLIAGLFSWRYWGKVGGIIILWAIIHIIGYSLINVPEYPWYYAPAILAICFLIGFGLKFLLDKTKSTGKRKIAASIIVLFYCSLLSINIFHIYRQTQKSALLNRRIAAYLQVGDWIKKNTSSSIKIAAVEIGGLGYSSKRNIIDMAGLVDAEGPRYISRRELDWWLRIHEPDLVLTHIPSWPIERPIEEDMRYELWRVFAYPGCETLQLFRLKSLNIKCPY